MRIPFTTAARTVGREDRLVRGCIALSLLLLVGFAVVMSGRSGPVSIVLVLMGLYFAVTAALGRDPFYAHCGIDTRTDAELARARATSEAWSDEQAQDLDLRESRQPHEHLGSSLLGS